MIEHLIKLKTIVVIFKLRMHRYFVIYKPYKMISQFISPYKQRLLGDLAFDFPPGTHAVGRLDEDSEGLLLLSTDKSLTRRLLHPARKHTRRYSVLVEREIAEETINKMKNGIEIIIKKKGPYTTLPCKIKRIEAPGVNFVSEPDFKEYIPHCWLEFELTEGKNRQIRKMCKAVRHNCKRLIRTSIEGLNLGDMKPGEVHEIEKGELFGLLRLDPQADTLISPLRRKRESL